MRPSHYGDCSFAEDPDRPASDARLFWRPDLDPLAIIVHAVPTVRGDAEGFDLMALPLPVTHLSIPSSGEQLLLGKGPRSIRLSIAKGTLLDGPVRLGYQLGGDRLDLRLLALRRLAGFLRYRRIPAALYPVGAKTRRWMEIITVLDAMAQGFPHRAIAQILFGEALVRRDWTGGSDYLRTRTHRLICGARKLATGGYIDLVRR